jgi:hypothetical protein
MERLPISELGLAGESTVHVDGTIELILSSRRFACGVRVVVPGFLPDDSYFGVEPGVKTPNLADSHAFRQHADELGRDRGKRRGPFPGGHQEARMITIHRWFRSGAYSLLEFPSPTTSPAPVQLLLRIMVPD